MANLLWLAGRLPWLGLGLVLLSAALLMIAVLMRSNDASLSRRPRSRDRRVTASLLIIYLIVFVSYQSSWQLLGRYDENIWATLNVVALIWIFRRALIPTTA
ncbi:hypothetical protein LZ519_07085 [Sphingomonas sp. RG327]|uniref:Uncharacterized protein n=1 Tax=Sphingomonas anseongensis TaxID=2908207 RepID=A0ABT0RFL9_9SPHN|nr:hypothetical protein [Sphingomonas anseongensis]MCL6679080.1 hypothetical protein [Sphingomonas anseongensis]